jgi:hypothetical protein
VIAIVQMIVDEKASLDVVQNISKEIVFSGSSRILILEAAPDIDAGQILQALNIQRPKALIMISGGAAKVRLNKRRQERLFCLRERE